ncbi:MAG: helix-turn-helix transcriptional regulator [Bacteroidota bacterium]
MSRSSADNIQNRFLAGLFFVLSIRIGKSVIFYFFEDIPLLAVYLQIGLSACFLIGPLLYFYIYKFFHQKAAPYWWVQLFLYLLIITVIYFRFPYLDFRVEWKGIFIPMIHIQWFVYLLLSGREIWRQVNALELKGRGFFNKKSWIISLFMGISLIWLAYVSSHFISYMMGALCFSFMLYVWIFLLLMGANRINILDPAQAKYGGKEILTPEAERIMDQLNFTLEQKYQDSSLTLEDISRAMGVGKHQLSQVLNEHYNINFSGYIRKFRVEKVKQLIQTHDKYTLQAIGEECGFKAKSSFYTAFKNETGMTPLQFKRKVDREKGSDL